jgi:flagellar biogenesis protein FliO
MERTTMRTTAGGWLRLLTPVHGGASRGWLGSLLQSVGRRMQAVPHHLSVEERLMVGGKKSILLIACRGRRFLLASSGDAITPLFEVLPLSSAAIATDQTNETEAVDEVEATEAGLL